VSHSAGPMGVLMHAAHSALAMQGLTKVRGQGWLGAREGSGMC